MKGFRAARAAQVRKCETPFFVGVRERLSQTTRYKKRLTVTAWIDNRP